MNTKEIGELLKSYMLTPALAGYEKNMAELFKDRISRYCDSVRVDRIGNVIGTIEGTDCESPKIMVYAHMDGIGWFVKHIDDQGFLTLERNGSPQEKVIAGTTVVVETEDGRYINGCFGTKPFHLMTEADQTVVVPLSDLYVDIGCDSYEQVLELGVNVGSPVMYTPSCRELLDEKLVGTWVDNRGGVTGVTLVAEYLSEHRPKSTVFLVGTVWEEFNLRGAMMASRTANVDIAIGLDGPGNPYFSTEKYVPREEQFVPVIEMFNFHGRGTLNGCIPHKGLYELAKKTAEDMGFTPGRNASRGGLSDSAYIQLEKDGVATIDIWTAGRYSHSYNEIADVKTLGKLGEMVGRMVCSIDTDFPLGRIDVG